MVQEIKDICKRCKFDTNCAACGHPDAARDYGRYVLVKSYMCRGDECAVFEPVCTKDDLVQEYPKSSITQEPSDTSRSVRG